ncbi:glycosyltransferase involved in cell wall biosynthesis [Leeuwenhoekiella aestuarii]|uniref:glycosyltransferase family 2 protein n=1 Tax=Leeuwenhoekiella aestuarii TaxID=2249426 RepID=UPI000FFEE50B|nr:glycosyltransferase family 2 protein [Leeuwenhoekiella aestuarii]RXG16139.1 glycosyltransferase involved in cell wall biosynthesis [Leeuwenhoekiella aestuarii]
MHAKRQISIIISTYNAPKWLEKTLAGYQIQTYRDFEIVVADDGSGQETKAVVDKFCANSAIPVQHIWHKDTGFQKTTILNKALVACNGAYVIMSDGDCIPRKDFVEQHVKYRKRGYFLSGGYHKLPMPTSEAIKIEDILQERCFEKKWLYSQGMPKSFRNIKITAKGFKANILNTLTPTKPTWNGHNASAWKNDIFAINGFDERMQYGGEDREMGERLVNYGIKGKQIRYSAICLHLEHARGYVNEKALAINNAIRSATKTNKTVKSPFGIKRQG